MIIVSTGRISWDMIHPGYKKQGFGKEIVQHCLDIINNLPGINKILVCTSQLAFNFYGRFGFKLKEIKKDFWAPGLDLYRMEMNKPI